MYIHVCMCVQNSKIFKMHKLNGPFAHIYIERESLNEIETIVKMSINIILD